MCNCIRTTIPLGPAGRRPARAYDDDDDQPDDEAAGGGGGERSLGEKLPDRFEVKSPRGKIWEITGGIEIHRLVVEDYEQLERRADDINEENINSCYCFLDNGLYQEVRQVPLPNSSPGDPTLDRLLLPSRGFGAPAAEQGR